MALRTKTIEYVFPQYTTALASATRYDFAAITLYIPETTSRTFHSVIVEVTCLDTVATATSMTANLIGIKLGVVAFDDLSNTITITTSGENNGYHLMRDVTSYFNTNFGAGASQTCQVGVSFTGPSTINHTVRLTITYESEEQSTRIKTVRFPLDSTTGSLTAVLTEIGTNQVLALDTFLPEDTKVYRDIFFVVEGNDACAGTVDFQLALALDAEAESPEGLHEATLTSARWFRYIWKRTDMATNVAHAFKARVNNVAGGTCDHLSIVLVVTYEYNHTNSTNIINSLAMPFSIVPMSVAGVAAGDKETYQIKFLIEEPLALALYQSGVQLYWFNDAASNLSVACGAQAVRTYADLARVYCGGLSCSHRIDSNGAMGAGITLARGENTFTISVYSSATNVRQNAVGGVLYLNYASGKHASGDGVHNHTIIQCLHFKNANLYLVQTATIQPQLPESNYWLNNVGWQAYLNLHTTGINLIPCSELAAERIAGEGPESGFVSLGAFAGYVDLEAGVAKLSDDGTDFFKKHPNDPNTEKLNVEGSRLWALKTFKVVCGSMLYITYHAITYTVAGTLSGYSGDGSGITVEIHRTDTDEKVLSVASAAGGGFTTTWYDNTINLYAHARQDATRVGRSDDALAS